MRDMGVLLRGGEGESGALRRFGQASAAGRAPAEAPPFERSPPAVKALIHVQLDTEAEASSGDIGRTAGGAAGSADPGSGPDADLAGQCPWRWSPSPGPRARRPVPRSRW